MWSNALRTTSHARCDGFDVLLLKSLHFLLSGLRLHLLHLDGVRLASVHVELVVAHAQLQDGLVDA